jgi:hypothetical protein
VLGAVFGGVRIDRHAANGIFRHVVRGRGAIRVAMAAAAFVRVGFAGMSVRSVFRRHRVRLARFIPGWGISIV